MRVCLSLQQLPVIVYQLGVTGGRGRSDQVELPAALPPLQCLRCSSAFVSFPQTQTVSWSLNSPAADYLSVYLFLLFVLIISSCSGIYSVCFWNNTFTVAEMFCVEDESLQHTN